MLNMIPLSLILQNPLLLEEFRKNDILKAV